MLAHLALHVGHSALHLGRIGGIRLDVHVDPTMDDLGLHVDERHAELSRRFREAAHEGGHIHGRGEWREAVGPVHHIDHPEAGCLLCVLPLEREIVGDRQGFRLRDHIVPPSC